MSNPTSQLFTGRWMRWAVLGLIGLGFLVRVWGITYGLPYLYHPDEPLGVTVALNMIKTGDLNPHFFGYGSLFFYLNAAAQTAYYLAGRLAGAFQTPADIPNLIKLALGVGQAVQPMQIIASRLVSILAGVLCIPVAYWLGSRLGGRMVGLLAAVFIACSPTLVLHSVFITPNILVTLMVMLTLLALLRLTPASRWPSFVLAGAALGGAVASKYNAALLVLPYAIACIFLYSRSTWKKPAVYLGVLAAGLTFLAVTPYAVLDANKFIADTQFHMDYYSAANHPGMEGNTLEFYLTYLLQTQGLLAFAGLFMALPYLTSGNRKGLILAAFAVPYVVYVSSLRIRNDRTILIVLPVLLIMAADGAIRLWRWFSTRSGWRRFVGRAALVTSIAISIGYLGLQTVELNVSLTAPDGREYARRWIEANVSPGMRIAAESYAPFIDPQQYAVSYFNGLRLNSPEWYVAQGYDLLVFSSGSYQRFYQYPDLYPAEIAQYDALFARFPVVAEFDQNGITIRILKVKS